MELAVDLSRLQFAVTALYHFLFVPLTIGLSLLLAIMESVYVMTGKVIWQQMTKFWGVLFGINFAMGVATGLTMEFQFGTNWAYYSHYVGDIFGIPLAIEGMMAFFLEATFIGLFFFGWGKLSKLAHLVVTWLLAIATNLSALWILIANAWMQNPVGAFFNPDTMRMELSSLYDVFFNPVAQSKFVHTVSAGYVTGAIFVMSISAYYLLKRQYQDIAKRSMTVAASFGLASALSVVVLGDESGYAITENQKMKIAAIEAMWETEAPPAGFTLIGFPHMKDQHTYYEVRIPWMLGIIATRSLNTSIPGIKELVLHAKHRITLGIEAYKSLQALKKAPRGSAAYDQLFAEFQKNQHHLGYGLLLKKYTEDIIGADSSQIEQAAQSVIPNVPVLFWSFRIMVGLGFFFIFLFAYAFYLSAKRRFTHHQKFLKVSLWALPLPWVAMELGWIVAEYGRQPWAIEGILPTFLGVSTTSTAQVGASLLGFFVFYTALFIIDILLMIRYVKLGPSLVEKKGAAA